MRTLKFSTDKCVFRYHQSNVRRFLPVPTTAERAVIKSNRRVQFSQHSRKLGGAAEHLIDGNEKCICRLSPHVIEKRSKNAHRKGVWSSVELATPTAINLLPLDRNWALYAGNMKTFTLHCLVSLNFWGCKKFGSLGLAREGCAMRTNKLKVCNILMKKGSAFPIEILDLSIRKRFPWLHSLI